MKRALFTLGLLWAALTPLAHAQAPEQAERVLFVGNSFSFYSNGIHNHFGNLIRAAGDWQRGENRVRLLTLSGGHIHETGRLLNSYLASGDDDWHVVVLQGHSNEPIVADKAERFDNVMAAMVRSLKQRDITPVLFMTWAYQEDPNMTHKLRKAYERVGRKNDAMVIPVGLAFAEAIQQYPEIDLYVKDVLGQRINDDGEAELRYRSSIKHPSMAGTYLAACVMYASLYQQSPEGNLFTAGLAPDTARVLQQLSWQVVSDYYGIEP